MNGDLSFRSGFRLRAPPSTALRVTPAERLNLAHFLKLSMIQSAHAAETH